MSGRNEIEADPYAHADANKLWELLKPSLRALQGLPERARKLDFDAAESQSGAVAKRADAAYFACLHTLPPDIEIDFGEHPTKFIDAQVRFPELRGLYVQRRVAARLHYFMASVINGQSVQ